jgi:hypothetical protein
MTTRIRLKTHSIRSTYHLNKKYDTLALFNNFKDPSATERLTMTDPIPFVVTEALSKVYYKAQRA